MCNKMFVKVRIKYVQISRFFFFSIFVKIFNLPRFQSKRFICEQDTLSDSLQILSSQLCQSCLITMVIKFQKISYMAHKILD